MFTVIIPLYNKKNTILDAIQSVLKQTFKDFELIIVDDGSNDGSYDIVRSIHADNIHLIHQDNQGVSVARNTGILNAKGKYICFLDADDLWEPNHLETIRELISIYPQAGLYASLYKRVDYDGNVFTLKLNCDHIEISDYIRFALNNKETYIHTNSVCIPKNVFATVGMFEVGEKIGEDNALWLRIASYYNVALINRATTTYRREYSDAYISATRNRNWSFIKIAEEKLLVDVNIPESKRESMKKYINRYRLSLCRHDLLEGDRRTAKEDYKSIDWKHISKKSKLLTDICFLIPYPIIRGVYNRKYRYIYKEAVINHGRINT